MRLSISFRGTTQQFILEWLELMCLYDDLTPLAAHYQPIQNAPNSLIGLKFFYGIQEAEILDLAKERGAIEYNGYINVVQRVAAKYDYRHPLKK